MGFPSLSGKDVVLWRNLTLILPLSPFFLQAEVRLGFMSWTAVKPATELWIVIARCAL